MSTTMSADCPRLIEVALPIREISAESMRQKRPQKGHISTMHQWWARRPLPTIRAIVFASLVPDPDDSRCPDQFRCLVEEYLKTDVPPILQRIQQRKHWIDDPDPYKPQLGVPDTLRNRLLAFIARWSPEWLEFEGGRRDKAPLPPDMLDSRSLIKWETADLGNAQGQEVFRIARELVQAANGGTAPIVFDPFAGGGAIPLEASRLGGQPVANDYNPVAHLILRATCEFPQKYGKPDDRIVTHKEFGTSQESMVRVSNALVHDLDKWTSWILDRVRRETANLYPLHDGQPTLGYIWARTAPCSNPSCQAIIPLLNSLVLRNKPGKQVAVTLLVDKSAKTIEFGIAKGNAIAETAGTMVGRANARCPVCLQINPTADLKRASLDGRFGERIVAVVTEGPDGKQYHPCTNSDSIGLNTASQGANAVERPAEPMPVKYTQAFPSCTWGFKTNTV